MERGLIDSEIILSQNFRLHRELHQAKTINVFVLNKIFHVHFEQKRFAYIQNKLFET